MKVFKQFSTDREMGEWLANEDGVAEMKKQYPPTEYEAHVDLAGKRVVVSSRGPAFAQRMGQTLAEMEAADPMVFSNERNR